MSISSTVNELAGAVAENLAIGDGDIRSGSGTAESALGSKSAGETELPTCVLVLGMAGSGKTTFVQKLTDILNQTGSPPYLVNLDPAVRNVPYPVNIDIRDTVKYKAVMERFGLGPNGAIMTSLNLFTTKFSSVLDLLEKRKHQARYMVFDTPGQIEVFTWSASGTIITEALADVFPTVVIYVMDLSTSTSPITFMSNMLYACSILYKSKLPFLIALNKTDLVDPSCALNWMTDFEAFDLAIEQEPTYAANLSRSLGLILDEFYNAIKAVPVSAATGQGFLELVQALDAAKQVYMTEYKPELQKMKEEQLQRKGKKHEDRFEKLKREVEGISAGSPSGDSASSQGSNKVTIGPFSEMESESEAIRQNNEQDDVAFEKFLETIKKNKETIQTAARKRAENAGALEKINVNIKSQKFSRGTDNMRRT
ncbi:GPN-loop GTPase 1-like isoform X1 [Paramacrobiotus metropolitanus]|uniref:GPN-loop GTPase 1-like isoform X1 n=1 Tax=Paramacrobiotus metropolitanus TaxID=2943436 RepID=UPI002445D09E|nr:GPN-loop GTPase 1-like isoform X1 [Paramacrobiotus metropolitanus]